MSMFKSAMRVAVISVLLGLFVSGKSIAQENDFQNLGILLDTSGEMGFVVPRVRKEVRLLNSHLKEQNRRPVPLAEMEGASIDQARGFGLPASRNALIQIQKFFEEEKIDGLYWITAFKGKQSGSGFALLNNLLSDADSEGEKRKRQLIVRHYWPEQILAGRSWEGDRGDVKLDPLHPGAYPEEWLEPVANSGGFVLRAGRILPEKYSSLAAHPESGLWDADLLQRYGLRFFRKGDYRFFYPVGMDLISRETVTPYVSEVSRKPRDQVVYSQMCRRASIEEDIALIDGEKIGVCFYLGYRSKDFSVAKSRPDKTNDPRVAYIQVVKAISDEIREHRNKHESTPGRVYDSFFYEWKAANRSRDKSHNEVFARRAVSLIRENNLDALYLFTNGFTDDKGYGTFSMDLEPLASFLKESGTKLYVRMPFEFGIVPIELKRLALSTGGITFFGSPDDPDFVFGRLR